jgi:hypothetical protein
MVLRKIFGPERDEVMGSGEDYSTPKFFRRIKLRKLRWAGDVARVEDKRGAYRVLVGKPDGRKKLGRPRRRWDLR